MYPHSDLTPAIRTLASEVYNRSWQFIEYDPVLSGEDRERVQELLAHRILLLVHEGERNVVTIANKAIAAVRQQYATQRDAVLEQAA